MKIGVVYGAHGLDEGLSVMIGEALEADPVDQDNVSVFRANELAIENGTRFEQENLVVAYENADPSSPIYERRRAAEVLGWCALGNFDLILDIHSTRYDSSVFAQVSPDTHENVIAAAQYLGFKDIVVSDFGLTKYFDNALTVEIAASTSAAERRQTVKQWWYEIKQLAADYKSLQELKDECSYARDPKMWAFVDGIVIDGFNLNEALAAKCSWAGFSPIFQADLEVLGLDLVDIDGLAYRPYAINYGSLYKQFGLVGEFVVPIGRANDHQWRRKAAKAFAGERRWVRPPLPVE